MDIVLSLPNLMLTYFCHMCDCLKRRHPKIHWFKTSFYLFELYLVGIFPIAKQTHFCLPKNIPFGGLLHEPSVRPKFSMATIDAPSQHLYFWCQDMAKQGPTRNPFSESMFGAEKNTPFWGLEWIFHMIYTCPIYPMFNMYKQKTQRKKCYINQLVVQPSAITYHR